MPSGLASPYGVLAFSTASNAGHLSRKTTAGEAVRLAPGVYVLAASLGPEVLAHHHGWAIAARIWPDAVICDRTALEGAQPRDGWIFLCHPAPGRAADLRLSGLTVSCRLGPGPLPGDTPFLPPIPLHLSSPVRQLVDNVRASGRPPKDRPSRRAGSAAVGDRIDEEARTGGPGRIQSLLASLDVLAPYVDAVAAAAVRGMLAGVLGTSGGGSVASKRLQARLAGEPWDAHRVALFETLSQTLHQQAPRVRPVLEDASSRTWLPFFEAYFSNYIEGTVFGLEEARAIAIDGEVPAARPKDAHDVAATYRIVDNDQEMARVPRTFDDLVDLLRERHGALMAARPEKRPGQFKALANFAGGYRFVDPDQMLGTLRRGFDLLTSHVDAFHRAVFMMFLVSECHPFDDGNGRIARIMVNAELVAGGQQRVVIPSSYRDNYLAALTALSQGSEPGIALWAVMDFSRAWVASVDWSTWESAVRDLEATHALLDSGVAESSGRRLRRADPPY